MSEIIHGSATTTHAIRAAIQQSDAPLKELAARYGLNRKTVAKWRKRNFIHDAQMGPKAPRSTILHPNDEAAVVLFRKLSLLPLDDCLYALQALLPHLTRSALHRCFQRHGVSRLPEVAGDNVKYSFRRHSLGYVRVAVNEFRVCEGKLYLFIAVDRGSTYVFARMAKKITSSTAENFVHELVEAVPFQIHTVLTDDSAPFAGAPGAGPNAATKQSPFGRACSSHGIEHRLTKAGDASTAGRVARLERALEDATAQRYKTYKEFEDSVATFVNACNFFRLKNLDGLTPHELICRVKAEQSERSTEPNRAACRLTN